MHVHKHDIIRERVTPKQKTKAYGPKKRKHKNFFLVYFYSKV